MQDSGLRCGCLGFQVRSYNVPTIHGMIDDHDTDPKPKTLDQAQDLIPSVHAAETSIMGVHLPTHARGTRNRKTVPRAYLAFTPWTILGGPWLFK